MTIQEILNTNVTIVSSNLKAGVQFDRDDQRIATVKQCLVDYPTLYADTIIKLRNAEYHSNEQKQLKLSLPCWFPCGVFEFGNIRNSGIKQYSNLLAIDIDLQDNRDIDLETLRKQIFDEYYVFGVFKSVSGRGYYAIVEVENGMYTTQYYTYIAELWKQKFGVQVDVQAKNIARKRFISLDEDVREWVKDTQPFMLIDDIVKNQYDDYTYFTNDIHTTTALTEHDKMSLTHKAIERLIYEDGYAAQSYYHWLHICRELQNFPDGFELFLQLSQNGRWNDSYNDILKKWKNVPVEPITDDTHRKWQGMAKNRFGNRWWIKEKKNESSTTA